MNNTGDFFCFETNLLDKKYSEIEKQIKFIGFFTNLLGIY